MATLGYFALYWVASFVLVVILMGISPPGTILARLGMSDGGLLLLDALIAAGTSALIVRQFFGRKRGKRPRGMR